MQTAIHCWPIRPDAMSSLLWLKHESRWITDSTSGGFMAQSMQQQMQPLQQKAFPVSWDQFHRDARALVWRLAGAGPFEAIVCVTRGGLVPAAIVARELDIRLIET